MESKMKLFKTQQKVIIIFLFFLLIISISFIVHLEIKAANLASKWEEHEKSLLKNQDVLDGLGTFARLVKNDAIRLDGNSIVLMDNNSVLGMDKNGIGLTSDQDIKINHQSGSELSFEKDDVKIKVMGDIQIGPSKDKYIGYKADEDRFYIHHSGSEIFLGEIKGPQGKPFANGIYIRGKVGGPYLSVNEKNIRLIAPMKNGLYDITIDPENKLLGLNCGNSYIVLDKDDIDIEAKGNISISALNGIVSINGKRVSLNE
jgi:hypothetical protein